MVLLDLGFTLALYRWFGAVGLQVAITTAIILANLLGTQLIQIFGIEVSVGLIFYSSIFFATDVFNENYGQARARQAVVIGFVVMLAVLLSLSLSVMLTPSANPASATFAIAVHDALETLASFSPRLVLGSLVAYVVSQQLDVALFHWLKRRTQTRWLWLRNNVSTMTSQLVDSLIFSLIAWWGVVDLSTALTLGLATYGFKLLIALLDTPLLYLARRWHQRGVINE
ncbi:MAG: queuosine precursor transporter [Pseudomonadota bacterium]